jgi:hypothetical protein
MRPALQSGLRYVWRNRDTIQIGIDPRRAVALTGVGGAAGLFRLLDGTRNRGQVLAAAAELGISRETADRVIGLLAASGVLQDYPAATFRALPATTRARLVPEAATAALAHGDGDGGAQVLARRRAAHVRVHGLSRTGLAAASLLSAAGVGAVVSSGDAAHPLAGSGEALPGPGQVPPGPGEAPPVRRPALARWRARADLVLLADFHQREFPAQLARERIPHLAVSASEAIGVVGPLVIPGYSACLRCLDLARAERDPAWPLILAQLSTVGKDGSPGLADPPGCDAVLSTAVAAQAAAQALAFIDRGPDATAVLSGTLELVLPGWQWKRRTWQRHPRCGCGAEVTPVAPAGPRDREWIL